MSTLLLRLAAPLQSWGTDSKYEIRSTAREPSKSGVLGLIACALGISREDRESLAQLNTLRFGVRVDREGYLLKDYHIAKSYKNTGDYLRENEDDTYQTWRYYLSDAVFLAGLEADDTAQLSTIREALEHPVYPLYLGRRACPPTLPLCLGIRELSLREALRMEPWLCGNADGRLPQKLRYILDAQDGDNITAVLQDRPVSFSRKRREYEYRIAAQINDDVQAMPEHDAMGEVIACT